MANKRARGNRAKTRYKIRSRGKPTVNEMLRELPKGEVVQIVINGSVHSGMPNHRWHGLTGKVKGKRGHAYEVNVKRGKSAHCLVVGPAHLSVLQQNGGAQ